MLRVSLKILGLGALGCCSLLSAHLSGLFSANAVSWISLGLPACDNSDKILQLLEQGCTSP